MTKLSNDDVGGGLGMGARRCWLVGASFRVGTGFTDAQREDYPSRYPPGTVVEFKYFELFEGGAPRFPIYLRVRLDVDPSEFPCPAVDSSSEHLDG